MHHLQLVIVPKEDLQHLINEAVTKAQQEPQQRQASDGAALSLNRAARTARRRREFVAQALASGALPAHRYGNSKTRARWSILATDVRDWLARGCPLEPQS